MNRRTFLKYLGIGAVTAAVNPVKLVEGLESDVVPVSSVISEPVDLSEYVQSIDLGEFELPVSASPTARVYARHSDALENRRIEFEERIEQVRKKRESTEYKISLLDTRFERHEVV